MRSTVRRRPLRDNAEVGVGTLIVFIAMVLVAAVAAAVIIGTSGTLQQRAQQTGREAITEVSSNMHVVSIYGFRNDTSTDIYDLKIYLTLSAGSQPVDLSQMIMRYSDGRQTWIYELNSTTPFTLGWIRGEGTDNVARTGDLVEVSFNSVAADLPPGTEFELQLIPITGAPVPLTIKTPATYSSDTVITLK